MRGKDSSGLQPFTILSSPHSRELKQTPLNHQSQADECLSPVKSEQEEYGENTSVLLKPHKQAWSSCGVPQGFLLPEHGAFQASDSCWLDTSLITGKAGFLSLLRCISNVVVVWRDKKKHLYRKSKGTGSV